VASQPPTTGSAGAVSQRRHPSLHWRWWRGSERDRAARLTRAGDQVVAAGVQRRAQGAGDHLQVGDLRLDLGQLILRVGRWARVVTSAVMVPAGVEQVGDGRFARAAHAVRSNAASAGSPPAAAATWLLRSPVTG
jgi:hypothetical protein